MLGPPLETFKANKGSLTVVVIIGLVALYAVYAVVEKDGSFSPLALWLTGLFLVPVSASAFWLNSVSVSLHAEGISYQSVFGSREMRWDEVERFYYSSVKQSVNFIPVGTYHTFKLISGTGQKLQFGNRMERPAELGQKLIEYTFEPLMNKLAERFNSGMDLDFGPIQVQRERGLKIKKTFRWHEIPWDQVAEYRIDSGTFCIFPVGKKYVTGPSVGEIPNAFVLVGLLDAVFEKAEAVK